MLENDKLPRDHFMFVEGTKRGTFRLSGEHAAASALINDIPSNQPEAGALGGRSKSHPAYVLHFPRLK